MTREEMMMNMIMELGHEHENTVMFCTLAESKNVPDHIIREAYDVLIVG